LIDIAEIIFKRSGYSIEYRLTPWTRTLADVKKGTVNGAIGIYFSQARNEGFVIPSEEMGQSINKFFVNSNNKWNYNGFPSLKNMKLGLIGNYDYGSLNIYIQEQIKQKTGNIEFTSGNDALQKNINKLLTKRIQAIVEDNQVVNYYLNNNQLSHSLRDAGAVPPENKVGICFSSLLPESGKLAVLLSDGIIQMRKTGELQKILDKYGVKDWKQNSKSSH
jgi:polar amino acid transport system substrate-binding protein